MTRVLFDHCVPKPLRIQLPDFEIRTCFEEGWESLRNGELLAAAQPTRRARNAIARRIGMGRRWLGLAQSAATTNAEAARDFLRRARVENPLLVLSPNWCFFRIFQGRKIAKSLA